MEYTVSVISKFEELPRMTCRNFFHSTDFFRIVEHTPGQKPYMIVAYDDNGEVVAHVLFMLRRRRALVPPYFFTQGRVYGEGEYATGVPREHLFRLMLEAINHTTKLKLCLFIEFSNISRKMFAYGAFRTCGYFPVRWVQIHDSLHSMPPEQRLTPKTARRISSSLKSGVILRKLQGTKELSSFIRLVKAQYRYKIFNYAPDKQQFEEMWKNSNVQMYVCEYHEKIIGCCSVIYSDGNAYLWYHAAKSKTYPLQHPKTMCVWQALKAAEENGCAHIYFMNAGLPFKKSRARDFLLSFGGKPTSTYRWFRTTIPWLNKLLSWSYSE